MREEHDRGQLPHQNTPLGGPHETKAHAISPPAGSGFRIRPSQLSFEKFVRSCWTPHHNDLGRLTGTFKPMRNFGFLPMPCANVLADVDEKVPRGVGVRGLVTTVIIMTPLRAPRN
jgi:hypothetical protein